MAISTARLVKYPEARLMAMGIPPHQIRVVRVFAILQEAGSEPTSLDEILFDYNDKYHPYESDPDADEKPETVMPRETIMSDLRKLCAEGVALRDETRKTYYVAASDEAQARINELKAEKAASEADKEDPKPGDDDEPNSTS